MKIGSFVMAFAVVALVVIGGVLAISYTIDTESAVQTGEEYNVVESIATTLTNSLPVVIFVIGATAFTGFMIALVRLIPGNAGPSSRRGGW